MSAGSLCWNCSSYWFYFWFSSRTRKKGSFLSTFWNENLKISDQLNTRFEGWVIKVEEKTWHHEVEESNGSLSSLTWSSKERAFSEDSADCMDLRQSFLLPEMFSNSSQKSPGIRCSPALLRWLFYFSVQLCKYAAVTREKAHARVTLPPAAASGWVQHCWVCVWWQWPLRPLTPY